MDSVTVILLALGVLCVGGMFFTYGRTYQIKEEMKRRQAQSDFEAAVQHEYRKRKGYGGAK